MAKSRTAQYVALYRALEHRERRRTRLFTDPYADAFLPPHLRALVSAAWLPPLHVRLSRYADQRAPGARTSAIARTRFIDDLVRRSVADGIGQLVVLGAGFDTRAHRLPELAAAAVFEVDRPGTQNAKRAVLRRLVTNDRVTYVPVDFLRDDLGSALAAVGWRQTERTLFVWEGVTNYLTPRAVAAVLSWIGAGAAGTRLVFTYVHAGLLDGRVRFEGGAQILENVQRLGEPWTFGLDPGEVADFLAKSGLNVEDELGADDYRARYLPAEAGGWGGYAFYRLAVAVVGQRPSTSRMP
jgi:methyltransferase (TIGR00027 family)